MEHFYVTHYYAYGMFPRLVIIDEGYNRETILENDILLFSNAYHN